MQHAITLTQASGAWMATFSDPEVAKIMGSDTIPTAYTIRTCAEVVQKALQKLNPGYNVIVSNSIDNAAFL